MSSNIEPNAWRRWTADTDVLAAVVLGLIAVGLWFSEWTELSIILLVPALLVSIWRPVGAFWATCAAIPLVFHPVTVGNWQFSLLEIGIILVFLGVALKIVTDRPFERLTGWFSAEPHIAVWFGGAALLLAGVISLFWMPEISQWDIALRNLRWLMLEPLMLFVVARYAIRSRGSLAAAYALALPAAVVAGAALIDVLTGDEYRADGLWRATGPYLHPNNLALYLERLFVLMASLLLLRALPLNRWNVLLLATIGAGLFATFSRGMVPAVAAGLLVVGLVIGNRMVVAVSLTGAVAGIVALAFIASDRFGGASVDGFIGERRHVWRAATSMIADYPVSGIGLDQFLVHHAPRYIAPEAWSERYISHPHNIVLDSWLSLGAPGLLLLMGAIVALVGAIRSWTHSTGPVSPSPVAAGAALVTGLVHGLVDNGYFLPDLAALTWILIAVMKTFEPQRLEPQSDVKPATFRVPA